ncbi:MAG: UvrB/UvrC motif-containing protein [Candidatus Poribacteria bacterium]|nr:UvrB/UvrC motif-containing protein [Candidatus Poribacteria bacterium]
MSKPILAVSIFLIISCICVGLYFITNTNKNVEPAIIYKVPSDTEVDKTNQDSKQVNQPKPIETDTETVDVDLTNQSQEKSYVLIAENESGEKVSVRVTADHLEKLKKEAGRKFYKNIRGVSGPPPEGYKYIIMPDGKAKRDENGNPITYKIGDPIFEIVLREDFAPTIEQFNQLKNLEQELVTAIQNEDFDKADNIRDQISTLRQESNGMLPYVNITVTVETPNETEYDAKYKRAEQLSKPVLYQAYREHGFEHLIPEGYK